MKHHSACMCNACIDSAYDQDGNDITAEVKKNVLVEPVKTNIKREGLRDALEKKMKPCPFCGPYEHEVQTPQILPWEDSIPNIGLVKCWLARCPECNARIKVISSFKSQALHTWNRREGKLDLSL